MASDPTALDTLEAVMEETRQRFTESFPSQCDNLRILVDRVAQYGPEGPVASLADTVHRLNGLAGTIGFPTVSARASELEDLVGRAEDRTFDGLHAGELVDAMEAAFTTDLARAGTPRQAPQAVAPVTHGETILVVEDEDDQRAIVTAGLQAARYAPVGVVSGELVIAAARAAKPAS